MKFLIFKMLKNFKHSFRFSLLRFRRPYSAAAADASESDAKAAYDSKTATDFGGCYVEVRVRISPSPFPPGTQPPPVTVTQPPPVTEVTQPPPVTQVTQPVTPPVLPTPEPLLSTTRDGLSSANSGLKIWNRIRNQDRPQPEEKPDEEKDLGSWIDTIKEWLGW
ncbi:hypothetical protein QQ045_002828 [Rhodiola kirilowii]